MSIHYQNTIPTRHPKRLFAPASDSWFGSFPVRPKYMKLSLRKVRATPSLKIRAKSKGGMS